MPIRRRAMLLAPIWFSMGKAFAQTDARTGAALVGVLEGMAGSFLSAARVTAAVTIAVTKIKPARLKAAQRAQTAAEIEDFYRGLTELSLVQRVMVGNIGDYVESVRARGFDEQAHTRQWRALVSEMAQVSAQVSVVYEMEQKAAWIKSALSAKDEQALADALRMRTALLDQLRQLPAPRTPGEIDKLASLNARYGELVRELAALRAALAEAKRRFA